MSASTEEPDGIVIPCAEGCGVYATIFEASGPAYPVKGAGMTITVPAADLTFGMIVSPSQARPLAAALLRFADKVEGRTPLVFFPPGGSEATYPPGHPSA